MIISRAWAMPNSSTFRVKPIRHLIELHLMNRQGVILDPFSRNSPFRDSRFITNDMSEEFHADCHMEALDFLNMFDADSVDAVLFDPPYSPRQITECYAQVGKKANMQDTQSSFYGDRKKAVARVVRPGGKVLCFGWNSGGIGQENGFRLEEILLVAHGGAHNDTICTVETKLTPHASLFG